MSDEVFELGGTSVDQLGVEHVIDVDPATGSAVVTVPIPVTDGRSGHGPSLSLSYDSGAGNSPFGVGWSLSHAPAVMVDTRDGLPRYDGSDRYAFLGDELVPETVGDGGTSVARRFASGDFEVEVFRLRSAGRGIRLERWRHRTSRRVHWRSRDGDDVVTVYGARDDAAGRIADPADESRTFAWLPEAAYDTRGNAIVYEYTPETSRGVDRVLASERARVTDAAGFAQRYLKRVRYGNTRPLRPDQPVPVANRFLFEGVVDYGDHASAHEPGPEPDRVPAVRADPHSSFNAGFELRTWRLARRVLLFHHFEELGDGPTLVQETRLTHQEDPAGSTLASITHTGVRRDAGGLTRRDRPPLTFTYAAAGLDRAFQPAPEEAGENVPQGISGVQYRFVDLLGDGLPGILAEDGNAWYYKRNEGGGRFGPQRVVTERPAARLGRFALADFDRDGNTNLVVMQGRDAGWYELDREVKRWGGYRPFPATPHVEGEGSRVQLMDLTGDGRPDVVVERSDRFTWFPSKGKDGFAEAADIPKPAASPGGSLPRLGEDPDLDFVFADMNGDGLPDLVRVRNGRVEYWPQIGHGRFGEAVVMDDSPMIDSDEEFDIRRLQLIDLDGSGTADLLYLGRGEIRMWTNAAGNRLVERGRIGSLPYIEELSSARVIDFLGDGTPCLVWSSPLAARATSMHYLKLAGPDRPRLLLSADNGMGLETRLAYGSSATHYLRDQRAGRGWSSHVPGHPLVVERREAIDQVSGDRTVTRFEYHDGCYDAERRRFGGFGAVDRYEVDERPVVPGDPDFIRAPGSCTRTFFHPGELPAGSRPPGAWSADAEEPLLAPHKVEDQNELTTGEYLDALRALRGRAVREEIFALDEQNRLAEHPLSVTQTRWGVRRDEPARASYKAALTVYVADRVTAGYEGEPDDPRVNHHMTLDVDGYGNPTLGTDVSYPRRPGADDWVPAQAQVWAEADRHSLLSVDAQDRHDLAIPVETEEFELWLPGVGAASAPLDADELLPDVEAALAAPLDHHEDLTGGATVRARRLEWERSRYWNANRRAQLPLGQAASPTLVHHEETACFTTEFVDDVYGGNVDAAALTAHGYAERDGVWWQDGPLHRYAEAGDFFALVRMEERDGTGTAVVHDSHTLTAVEIRDALDNRWGAEIDYHVISPWRVTDPNGTVGEAIRDPLGVMVVGTSSGHVAAAGSGEEPHGDDPLDDYLKRAQLDVASALADPRRFLQNASHYFAYDLDAWATGAGPVRTVAVSRERSVYDTLGGEPGDRPPMVQVGYMDGFGRELQTKQLVDPGPAFARDADGALVLDSSGQPTTADVDERWLATGHAVYDGRQRVVQRYEPFFSSTPGFEPDAELASFGVSATSRYDAIGRPTTQELPNGTTTRAERSSWRESRHDPNDTVVGSLYETLRDPLPQGDPEKQALVKARTHANTPVVVHMDARGIEVRVVEAGASGAERVTNIEPDAEGRPAAVRDPRGVVATRERHDMAGRRLLQETADAGVRRILLDSENRPAGVWDARGVHQRFRYDTLGRLAEVEVEVSGEPARLVEQLIYGDTPGTPRAQQRNVRGRLVSHRDEAGVMTFEQYDPAGRPLRWERRLRRDPSVATDWRGSVPLEDERHSSELHYDAIGQIVRERLPDGADRTVEYGRHGGVGRMVLRLPGTSEDLVVLGDATYDARGQRTRAELGTRVEISQRYDPETFAAKQVRARRTGASPRTLMDLSYTYDPAGNVVLVTDAAQQPTTPTPLLQGLTVASEQHFTYDPWYQLVEATGRVHQALLPQDHRPRAPGTVKGTRHLTLNNGAAVERYRRTFRYDPSGNLVETAHDGATTGWTAGISVAANSNRALPTADVGANAASSIAAAHDPAGNVRKLAHVRSLEWTPRGGLHRGVIIDRSASGQPDDEETYQYGADGMRTRKVTRRLVNGSVETTEKIYLEGCEIKRVRRGASLLFERVTSMVSDGSERLAVVHRWTTDENGRETDSTPATHVRLQLNSNVGSSRLEVDPEGRIIAYEEFFPFGGSAFIAGDRLKEVERRDYRYMGKESDDATGLIYFGHRYFQPWLGRWLSADPSGPADGQNLYRYVHNNPVNLTDPDGLQSEPRRRGRVHEGTVTQPPPPVLKAWGRLTDAQRANWRRRGGVYWRVNEAGQGILMTREGAIAHEERVLAAGRDFTRLTVNPDARRGPNRGAGRADARGSGSRGGGSGNTRPRGQHGGRTRGGGSRSRGAGGHGSGSRCHGSGGASPQGGAAGDRGRLSSRGSNAGAEVHAADGGSGTSTQDPAGGNAGSGEGNDDGGDGAGTGGPGTDGTGPGAGDQESGTGGGGTSEGPFTGTGEGAGTGTGTGVGPGGEERGHGGGDTGEGAGRTPGGDRVGGRAGRTRGVRDGTATTPSGGTGGEEGGSPPAIVGATRDGAPAVPGAQPGGRDPNGTTQNPGEQRGNGGGQAPREERRSGGTPGGRGDQPGGERREGPPGGQRQTTLDRITRWAGYLNFEFGNPPLGGQSGGIPGGTGKWNLGAFGQILYIAVTVISTISLVKSLVGGAVKLGKMGVRALLRRGVVALKAVLPAARAALGAAGAGTRSFLTAAILRPGGPRPSISGGVAITRATLLRELRRIGTREALATASAIARDIVDLRLVNTAHLAIDQLPARAVIAQTFLGTNRVEVYVDRILDIRRAASIAAHETKHVLQRLTEATYHQGHEFEAYIWASRVDPRLPSEAVDIWKFIRRSPLYQLVDEAPATWRPNL